MDSKWFLASKRVQGALAALIGLFAALYGLDLTDSQAMQYAGDALAAAGVLWHAVGWFTRTKALRLRRKPTPEKPRPRTAEGLVRTGRNDLLRYCMIASCHPVMAWAYWLGVRVGAGLWWRGR